MDVLSFLIKVGFWLTSYQELISNLLVLFLAIAALHYRKNDNKLFIIGVVLAPSVIDTSFIDGYMFSDAVPSYAVYLIYSLYDLVVILLLLYRENIVRLFLFVSLKLAKFADSNAPIKQEFIYFRHVNEYKVIIIYVASIAINIIVSAEYPARWYINDQLLYCYYLYKPAKLLLNILLVYYMFNLGSTDRIQRSK